MTSLSLSELSEKSGVSRATARKYLRTDAGKDFIHHADSRVAGYNRFTEGAIAFVIKCKDSNLTATAGRPGIGHNDVMRRPRGYMEGKANEVITNVLEIE